MTARLTPLMALMIGACAPMPQPTEPPPPLPEGQCDASTLTALVGRPASAELAAEALARSGARSLRWIQPGMAVTMDYRLDRLNIDLDSSNRVKRFHCG